MSGKFYEELQVGDEFAHLPARTVTETDNLLFTTLTMNTQPLHLDEEFAKKNYGSVQAYKDMLKKKIDKLLNASNCN